MTAKQGVHRYHTKSIRDAATQIAQALDHPPVAIGPMLDSTAIFKDANSHNPAYAGSVGDGGAWAHDEFTYVLTDSYINHVAPGAQGAFQSVGQEYEGAIKGLRTMADRLDATEDDIKANIFKAFRVPENDKNGGTSFP
jgi:hypothetical protein